MGREGGLRALDCQRTKGCHAPLGLLHQYAHLPGLHLEEMYRPTSSGHQHSQEPSWRTAVWSEQS